MRKRWKPELRPVLAYNLKPVIAAVHDACVGGGVDIVAACDIWCCSKDTTFVLKEVDMAIVADLGALQWLPRIVGYRNAANLALTGRKITAMEAKEMGLVSRVFNSKQELDDGVAKIAKGKDAPYWSGRPFRRKPSKQPSTAPRSGFDPSRGLLASVLRKLEAMNP